MNYFKKLPVEVENTIWNLYWMDVYKTNVITQINRIKVLVQDLDKNINLNNILRFTNENKKLDFLQKYNQIIQELNKDKGTIKLSLIFNKNLYYAFNCNDNIYLQYKHLRPVTNYLMVKSGIMRYSAYHSISN
jgi:hypothetical protein